MEKKLRFKVDGEWSKWMEPNDFIIHHVDTANISEIESKEVVTYEEFAQMWPSLAKKTHTQEKV